MPQTYSDFVAFRSQDNPCTARLSAFLEPGLHRPQGSCKIDIVDYQGDNVSHYAKLSASDLTPSHLEPPPTGQGRVVMVEDLHPAVLEVLATTLDIDPLFFAEYLFTRYDDIEISPAPPSSALPPSWALSNASSFHIHFQQAVSLSRLDGATKKWPWTLRTVGNVDRSVRRMIDLQPGRQLGLLRGCCSVLKRVFDRSWIAPHLVDARNTHRYPEFEWKPLHGGSERFEQPVVFSTFQHGQLHHQSSGCLADALISYLTMTTTVPTNPTLLTLAYFPLRTIIGEWRLYIQTLARILKHYEISTHSRDVTAGGRYDIIDLQKWRHRAIQSSAKIYATRSFVARHAVFEAEQERWELVLVDLDWIADSIRSYAAAFESAIPLISSVVQLVEARQTMAEAADVRLLTWVAVVFVPLSWVAGVFSMAEGFQPGHRLFWVYFAVAVPLSVVLTAGAMALSKWRSARTGL